LETVFERVAAVTVVTSAALRLLLDTFGADSDMVVVCGGREFNDAAELRDARNEFGRRFLVSLIAAA